MILLLGGTREANQLARRLQSDEIPFITTVVSSYGARLARETNGEVLEGRLDEKTLEALISEKNIDIIVDMTHPYAVEISEIAYEHSQVLGISYYRYERPSSIGTIETNLIEADSYTDAAVKSCEIAREKGGTVFLTIGSKQVYPFLEEAKKFGVRLVCRVLPDGSMLEALFSAGLATGDVIAVQGPFGHQFNKAMFAEYQAAVIVTKDAGEVGGTDTKLSAAAELGIPVLVVKRPVFDKGTVFNDMEQLIRRVNFKNE